MKKRKFLLIVLFIVGGNYIYSQTPDITPPNIYKEILPGFKSEHMSENPSQESFSKNQESDKPINLNTSEESQKTQSIFVSIKELLSNKTLMNIIILITIFVIFFIYRFRRSN